MHYLALFFLDHEHVKAWMQAGGYSVMFGLLLACGLGLPLPEDIPIITAGIMIAHHHMHWEFAAPIAWCGVIGGDCVLYSLGWKYGYNITRVPIIGRHVTTERIKRAEILFAKYGILVVGVGRMFAGIRGAMVVAAGTTRFKFPKFIIADGLGAVVSGGLFMTVGFWLGKHTDHMGEQLFKFKIIFFSCVAVLMLAVVAYIWWRSKKHETLGDAAEKQTIAFGDKKL